MISKIITDMVECKEYSLSYVNSHKFVKREIICMSMCEKSRMFVLFTYTQRQEKIGQISLSVGQRIITLHLL